MTRIYIWRQLLVASRSLPVWTALAVHLALLTAYLTVWGDGVPVAGARDALDQFASAHLTLLAIVVPWIAARGQTVAGRDELARRAILGGHGPAPLALGTALGAASIGALVAVLAVPLLIVAQQVSARPLSELAPVVLRAGAFGAAVAFATSSLASMLGNSLVSWMGGCLAGAAAAWALPNGLRGAAVTLLVIAVGAVALWQRASRSFVWRQERAA